MEVAGSAGCGRKADDIVTRSLAKKARVISERRAELSSRHTGSPRLRKASSKACFWDNQENGGQFEPLRGEVVPFSRFGGGADLVGSVGGVCTGCHAGENPFIIHPGTALGRAPGSAE